MSDTDQDLHRLVDELSPDADLYEAALTIAATLHDPKGDAMVLLRRVMEAITKRFLTGVPE
jgi:hypothetical protein